MSKGKVYRPTLIDLSREERQRLQGADNKRKTLMTNYQNKVTNVGAQNSNFTVKTVKKDTKHLLKIKKKARIRNNSCTYKITGDSTDKRAYNKSSHYRKKSPGKAMTKSTANKSEIEIWVMDYSISIYFNDIMRIFLSRSKRDEINATVWISEKHNEKILNYYYSRRIPKCRFSDVLYKLKIDAISVIWRLLKYVVPRSMKDLYIDALREICAKNITPEIYVEVVLFVPPEHILGIDVKEKFFLCLNEREHVIDDIILAEKYRALCIDLIGAIINRSSEVITKELTIILVELTKDLLWYYNMRYYAAGIMGISALWPPPLIRGLTASR